MYIIDLFAEVQDQFGIYTDHIIEGCFDYSDTDRIALKETLEEYVENGATDMEGNNEVSDYLDDLQSMRAIAWTVGLQLAYDAAGVDKAAEWDDMEWIACQDNAAELLAELVPDSHSHLLP